jgi:TPR repeat protein
VDDSERNSSAPTPQPDTATEAQSGSPDTFSDEELRQQLAAVDREIAQKEQEIEVLNSQIADVGRSQAANAAALAMNQAALACFQGMDVKDYATAVPRCREAAELGSVDAELAVGDLYSLGYGVSKDSDEAMKWYRRAADHGSAEAEMELGLYYVQSRQTEEEAYKWFQMAAEQGYAPAMLELASDVRDSVASYMWSELAVAYAGSDEDLREEALDYRSVVASELTREEIAEAQRRARAWRPKSSR